MEGGSPGERDRISCGSEGQGEDGRYKRPPPGLGMNGSGGIALQEELKEMSRGWEGGLLRI